MAASANTLLHSLEVRKHARNELATNPSMGGVPQQQSSSKLLGQGAGGRRHQRVASKAEKMNGWQASRSSIYHVMAESRSEPILSVPVRFRGQQHVPLHNRSRSPEPPAHEGIEGTPTKGSEDKTDGRAAASFHEAPRLAQVSPRHALHHEHEVSSRQSAVFLSPQRTTTIAREQLQCAAPGYYDSSVLSAPWTLAGALKRPHALSPAFSGPGRALPPIGSGSGSNGAGTSSGSVPRGKSFPSLQQEAASLSRGESHKLARKEREIQQLLDQQQAGARRGRGQVGDRAAFKSPAEHLRDQASLEQRLISATSTPKTDLCLVQLMAHGNQDGGVGREFLDELDVGYDASAGRTLSGPHVAGSLKLSSEAFVKERANW